MPGAQSAEWGDDMSRKVRVASSEGPAPRRDDYVEVDAHQPPRVAKPARRGEVRRVTEADQDRIRIRLMDWMRWQFGGVSSSAGMLGRVAADTSGYRSASIPVNLEGDAERVNRVMLVLHDNHRVERDVLVWHYTGCIVLDAYAITAAPRMSQAQFARERLHLNRRRGYHELLAKAEQRFLDMLAGRYVAPRKPLCRNDSLKMSNKLPAQSV